MEPGQKPIPLDQLPIKTSNSEGYFTGSQDFLIAEITEARHKWIHEFKELPQEEQAKYLAHQEIKIKMRHWHEQEAERIAKEEAKKDEKKYGRPRRIGGRARRR